MPRSHTAMMKITLGFSLISLLFLACGSPESPDSGTVRDSGRTEGGVVIDTPNGSDIPDLQVDVPNGLDVPNVPDVPSVVRDVPNGTDVPSVSPSPCGVNTPENGTACPREGLVCQYGDDPRESCRATATCTTGRWQLTLPRCMAITPPAMCPASRDMAAGMACTTMNAVCAYSGLLCECSDCERGPVIQCGQPLVWRCNAPNVQANCPMVQPNLGTVCSPEATRCGYDCAVYGVMGGRVCSGGIWIAGRNDCPVSSRRAKRDIVYLNTNETESIARAALGTRLATYEYTDPALRGPRRLGFILEDPTTHPYARDPDVSVVDMYGYTSMLLATVQSQQRQIDQLQQAVRALQNAPVRRARAGR